MKVLGGRLRAHVGSVVGVGLVVQKFGGTSVADAERMRAVADHVALTRRRGDRVVLVVSAMGNETDDLLRLASEVGGSSRAGREMDMLITAGERKATALMCLALHEKGVPAESYTGSQAGFMPWGVRRRPIQSKPSTRSCTKTIATHSNSTAIGDSASCTGCQSPSEIGQSDHSNGASRVCRTEPRNNT